MSEPILVIGAGYHGKVLSRTADELGSHRVVAYLDDNPDLHGATVDGVPVEGPLSALSGLARDQRIRGFQVGVGECHRFNEFLCEQVPASERVLSQVGTRRAIYAYAKSLGLAPTSLIHPRAVVTPTATVGAGAYMAPGVVIHYDTVVGENVILFCGTTIDHDNVLGDHVFIGPGSHTGGQVTIGPGCYIGPGSTIGGGVTIGANTIVGAGSVVLHDLPEGVIAYGAPARPRQPLAEWFDRPQG